MKTWTNPTIEELAIELTAGKGDKGHCELHWPGNGHGGPSNCNLGGGGNGVGNNDNGGSYYDPDGDTMS